MRADAARGEVFRRRRRELKGRISSPCAHPLGAPLPQHFNRGITIDQFTALSLSEAHLDMGRYGFALFEHPVFEVKLFADDGERLFQDLAGISISAGPHGQVDHALLFGFQVNRHGGSF
jgi:hypothetical protein